MKLLERVGEPPKGLDGLGRFVQEEQNHLAELIAEDEANDRRRGK